MSLFAVSDLHIHGPDDPLYHSLITLVRDRAEPDDVVVLAGDLFDLFVGNKSIFIERYSEFIHQVSKAGARGVKIHYIEGNHDFFLRKVFQGMRGVFIHPDEVSVEISDKKFFFAHGDQVDKSDYGYRFLRAFLRSPFMRAFVAVMPGFVIDRVGQTGSYRSKKARSHFVNELPVSRMEVLRKKYRSFAAERMATGFDFVVLGHCHDLDEMFFNIGGRRAQYVNIGYPRVHGSFVSWLPGDEKIHREKLPCSV